MASADTLGHGVSNVIELTQFDVAGSRNVTARRRRLNRHLPATVLIAAIAAALPRSLRRSRLPIIAMPSSDMMGASAKSRLTRPRLLMISEMPATAVQHVVRRRKCRRKAIRCDRAPGSAFVRHHDQRDRHVCSSSTPPVPRVRFCISKRNGLVTTARPRECPHLWQLRHHRRPRAGAGAAPMPAVMNSMSAPRIDSRTAILDSIAASRPTSGLAPAPSSASIRAQRDARFGAHCGPAPGHRCWRQ